MYYTIARARWENVVHALTMRSTVGLFCCQTHYFDRHDVVWISRRPLVPRGNHSDPTSCGSVSRDEPDESLYKLDIVHVIESSEWTWPRKPPWKHWYCILIVYLCMDRSYPRLAEGVGGKGRWDRRVQRENHANENLTSYIVMFYCCTLFIVNRVICAETNGEGNIGSVVWKR